jgi:hypothetical protein
MNRSRIVLLCMGLAVLLALTSSSFGAVQFMNINFDGDTLGASPSLGPRAPLPITAPQAIGGYSSTAYSAPPSPTDNGTVVVDNAAGMSKAAVWATSPTNDVVGSLFMDTGFGVASHGITVDFDIAILAATATANNQLMTVKGAPGSVGALFGLRAYNSHAGAWAFTFIVAPTSESGGIFALRDTGTQLTAFGNYVNGQAHHVTLVGDYDAGVASAYLDGALAVTGFPLRGGPDTAATTSEIFMYMNGEAGYTNSLAIDNIAATDAAIPEPATMIVWGLLGVVAASFGAWRRRAG